MSSPFATPPRKGGPVRRLPEALIDQIAAGEVVERPASVVKELVENALDAGAGRVRVEVRAGGRDWIAVSDDGSGMTAEDARCALERHATSKLAGAADLERIATYGFRGEALPAIASVSRMCLRTRPRGAPEAFEIRVEAGRRVAERAVGAPEGTRVEVAELFAAVPARRKFLKTAGTEWGHIADWLARAALALPGVHFDVQRDERPALVWPATGDALDRIAAVVSEEDAAAFVPVEAEEGGLSLRGFVSRPDRHRPTLGGVYLFVNRRPVRDRLLQHALVEVYRDQLPRGRFPSAVLFLEVPPEVVDVNVHPAKWEVRFADPQLAHRLVRRGARDALERRTWLGIPTEGKKTSELRVSTDLSIEQNPTVQRAAGERSQEQAEGAQRAAGERSRQSLHGRSDWLFADRVAESAGLSERVRLGDQRLLGQLLTTYLVLETKDGLLLVDQHAAHERVLFERLRAQWLAQGVACQRLLVSATVGIAPSLLAGLEAAGEAIARLGFELEPFGEDTAIVRGVPALLADRDPAALVRSLADELAAAGTAADAARLGARVLEAADAVFATLACHSARRKGDALDPREARALLEEVDSIPWAPSCPHGRPVVVPFPLAEIERRFGRR